MVTSPNGLRTCVCYSIDEYQDTNPLQEAILLRHNQFSRSFRLPLWGTMISPCIASGEGQSSCLPTSKTRCSQATRRSTNRVDMVRNFRSQPEIVSFFNGHISSDPDFQTARINPPKPLVTAANPSANISVLGMFRPDDATLGR